MRHIANHLLAIILVSTIAISGLVAQDYRTGIRIGWDYRTQKFVTGGAYGRLKVLSDGRHAFVYDEGGVCKIRFRRAGLHSSTFSSPTTVATPATVPEGSVTVSEGSVTVPEGSVTVPEGSVTVPEGSPEGYYTNCELLELADGTLMYAYNERVSGTGLRIKVKYSTNAGRTWIKEQTVAEVRESDFIADEGYYGIWEPAMIQLPSGEVQLYYASEFGVPGHDQKIVMLRSLAAEDDGTRVWEPQAVDVSYTVGYRDGMPVPLVLQDDKGIVFAIEDDGFGGGFQPGIIYSSMADNWKSGTRYASSRNRWVAIIDGEPRGGGAPYIIQLTSGETLVSTQTNYFNDQRGAALDDMYKNRPFVYIGDANARNFCRYSIPFPFLDEPDQGGVWNSLCQLDDSTVVCVSDVHGHPSQSGLWMVDGHIMHPLSACSMPAGTSMDQIDWAPLMSDIIVGSHSQAQLHVASCWTADSLFLHFVVYDRQQRSGVEGAPVWDTDGVEFYCDMYNRTTDNVPANAVKYLVNIDGGTLVTRMASGGWTDVDASVHQMRHVVNRTSTRYTINMALPWGSLLKQPRSKKFAAYFKLHNNDLYKGKERIYHEVLSGTDEGRVSTWWQVTLDSSVDGITSHAAVITPCADTFYNLQGMTTASPRRGIYVKDGKKIVIQ